MAYEGIAKVQHYVPQFLLKNFGNGKKDQLYVFDKRSGRTFSTNARNIAAESRFYDFEVAGQKLSLEPGLSLIETKAKPIIHRILDADSLTKLTEQDRALLSVFFSVQFIRTRHVKEQFHSLSTQLGEHMRRRARNEGELEAVEEYVRIPDENEKNVQMARFVIEAPNQFAGHFANKAWVLLRTDRKTPFQIGDHPLAMQNMNDMRPYGNLGLAVPGIEIYFPLSPTRAIALWCPTLVEMFRQRVQDKERHAAPYRLHELRDAQAIDETWAAINHGVPLLYKPENVQNFNSLQIRFAERYVMSSMENFDLARSMIADHPHMRTGPRPEAM